MDCVNHPGVAATAFCQNCGKAMCATCTRNATGGQVLCEPCTLAWQNLQQPFVAPPVGAPNPIAAGVLGLIPGVGAMYNGQFFKGLIHVVIFAVLISITDHYGIFGIFIGAWVLYQSFEAYHTAVARRDGLPLPDPLGLNEVGNWLNLGGRPTYPPPPTGMPNPGVGPAPGTPGGYQAPYAGSYAPPAASGYQATPYTPVSGYTDPGMPPPPPPVPPVPPLGWRRKEPIGALILIGFGLILLLNQMGFMAERVVHYMWPLIFIAIGAWLIVRRVSDTPQGRGPFPGSQGDPNSKGGTQ
ncbi:MAG TPA: B-box zinc finger protein [Terracidiphilus sp.]|nr:B-box zinc finger protein [Terracidiphilus sp.]